HCHLPLLHTAYPPFSSFFSFHPPPPTQLYPLSLHDALPIYRRHRDAHGGHVRVQRAVVGLVGEAVAAVVVRRRRVGEAAVRIQRSEEHTSELQSPDHLVCRLLLEKKNSRRERPAAERR